jgi:hypothetical protein
MLALTAPAYSCDNLASSHCRHVRITCDVRGQNVVAFKCIVFIRFSRKPANCCYHFHACNWIRKETRVYSSLIGFGKDAGNYNSNHTFCTELSIN